MMKFFRKHTKELLAVFMALLLIVWLGGDALTSLLRKNSDGGDTILGTAHGETIRIRDVRPTYVELETLDEMGIPFWKFPWGIVLQQLGIPVQQYTMQQIRPTPLSKEEFYMLDIAAIRNRIHIPPQEVENFKNRLGLSGDMLAQVRQRTRKSMEEIDRAFQSFLRVEEAALMAAQAVKVTEADVNELIRQTGEKARVEAVVLDVKAFVDNSYEPTPQEIQVQFDKYKNVASRPGDVGYQQPRAAQIEYIEVDAAALAREQKIDEQEAYSYWKAHSGEFMKPASQPATSSAPSTAPASQPKPYTSFSEARTHVIEKLQKDKARTEALRIARDLITKLQEPWARVATTQPGDAKTAPESEKAADVYQKAMAEFEKKHPGAITYRKLDMLAAEQLQAQSVGKSSALPNSNQQMPLNQAAFLVPGAAKGEETKNEKFYRGLYETAAEPFVDSEGNAYVIRTIAVKPDRAPESIDAVRNQIVQDIRTEKARAAAEQAARKLQEQAAQKGLEAALHSNASLQQKLGPNALQKPDPFPHQFMIFFGTPQFFPASIPGIGQNAELLSNIFGMANRTATQPNKVTMVHDKSGAQNRFIVAQLLEILPVTREEYNKQRQSALQTLEAQRRMNALEEWFSPEHIRARLDWIDAEKSKPTPAEDSERS